MKIPPFALERYFAQHEFTAPYMLCASDCESISLKELLDYEPTARTNFEKLWLGYSESLGSEPLREIIAGTYETMTKHQVLVHAGAQEAIFSFMNMVLERGDHVIVHWPCYQSLFQIAETLGCEVTKWEGDSKNGWELDVDFLRKQIKPNTKAVILNTPHNPTGYLMPRHKLDEVVRVVQSVGCFLFMDEVYKGLEYDETQRLPSACDVYENGVSLGVMSKNMGLAGLRVGWIATKNKQLYDDMAAFKDYTTICTSAPSEFLTTLALRHREKIIGRNREIIATNLGHLTTFMQKHSALFTWVKPKAGCIAFPQLLEGTADEFCATALKRSGVLLAPGSKFGYAGEGFRLGFGRRGFVECLNKLGELTK